MTDTIPAGGFEALGITGQLLKATGNAGFAAPKPIQAAAIPPFLAGKDILGVAQTGSGKTAAFALPILSRIATLGSKRRPKTARALVLVPTRELAVQIEETIRLLSKGMHISTALVLGGVSRFSQIKKIQPGVDVLIATPGRLTDLVREGAVVLSETTWLVLDEADRMLDMGFINDVRRIAKATHAARQTALFSATMPDEIVKLAEGLLRDPVRVEIAPQSTAAAEIRQSLIMARTRQKRKVLADLLADPEMSSVIIFARTKHGADRVARDLGRDGFEAGVIHGNKSQNARQKALNGFRDGSSRILVATDIAARGIDVVGISHVINFDLPDEAESYVHRIGRTGRNGRSGIAITLCDPSEFSKLRQVERITRVKLPIAASFLDQPDPQRAAGQEQETADERRERERTERPIPGQNRGRPQRHGGPRKSGEGAPSHRAKDGPRKNGGGKSPHAGGGKSSHAGGGKPGHAGAARPAAGAQDARPQQERKPFRRRNKGQGGRNARAA